MEGPYTGPYYLFTRKLDHSGRKLDPELRSEHVERSFAHMKKPRR